MPYEARIVPEAASGHNAPELVLRLAAAHFGWHLTSAQASALWAECRAYLETKSARATVEEIETSELDFIDSLVRDDVLAVVGLVLVGKPWGSRCGETTPPSFRSAMNAAAVARGYTVGR